MSENGYTRKLVAILSADAKDYSRLMDADEDGTLRNAKACFQLMSDAIGQHRGRVVDCAGDNLLAEFASVVNAVQCAVEIQDGIRRRNEALPEERRLRFRIGINLGDVIEEDGRLYGGGVNIASRIEHLAEGGEIFLSGTAYDQVRNKVALGYEYRGAHAVKNIPEPVRVYKVVPEGAGTRTWRARLSGAGRWRTALFAAAPGIIVAAVAAFLWSGNSRPPLSPVQVVPVKTGGLPAPDRQGAPAGAGPREQEDEAYKRPIEKASFEKPSPPAARGAESAKLSEVPPRAPAIAVLPFENLSGDADQEHLSDGFTDEIISALSKLPDLDVISKSATFVYKRKPGNAEQIGRQLGATHLLEGSVQRSGSRLRVVARLLAGDSGRQVWADRFDRTVEDLFWTRDQVVLEIAAATAGNLTNRQVATLVRRNTKSLEAWEALQRGHMSFERHRAKDNLRAREWYEKAAELDPKYVDAWTMIGLTHWTVEHSFRTEDSWDEAFGTVIKLGKKVVAKLKDRPFRKEEARDRALKKAVRMGNKVVAMDPSYPGGYFVLAGAHLSVGRHQEAVANGRRAVELEPSNTSALAVLASALTYTGKPEEAIPLFRKAMRLCPAHRPWYLDGLGLAYHLTGRSEKAIETLRTSAKQDPQAVDPHLRLAVIHAEQGRDTEMRAEAAEVLRLDPKFAVETWAKLHPFANPKVHEQRKALMRKAGLPG